MSLQEFIGVINAEAECHLRLQHRTNLVFSTKAKNNKGKATLLFQHITSKFKDSKANNNSKENQDKKPKKPYCKQCKTKGHITKDCDKWDEEPCAHCG